MQRGENAVGKADSAARGKGKETHSCVPCKATVRTGALTQRCPRFHCLDGQPEPRSTHLTEEETDPGGGVMGPESPSLSTRVEPSCSWAAPNTAHVTACCCPSNAHPRVTVLLSPQPATRALACPCLAQFRCHLCKQAFSGHPISMPRAQ